MKTGERIKAILAQIPMAMEQDEMDEVEAQRIVEERKSLVVKCYERIKICYSLITYRNTLIFLSLLFCIVLIYISI
jgi:hypothetical protein